jgi:Xaa-Pro aminopeptidase
MVLSDDERERRLSAAEQLMEERDLDAILITGWPGDGAQARYYSLFTHSLNATAVILRRGSRPELIVPNGVMAAFAGHISWMSKPIVASGSMAATIAEQLVRLGAGGVGVAGLGDIPASWLEALSARLPAGALHEVAGDLLRLRWVKSEEELGLIRHSCQIADDAWSVMAEVFRLGRREYEILADIQHMLFSRGCDGSFDLIWSLPLLEAPFDRQPSDRIIEPGDTLLVEVSPRWGGYYAQETAVITTDGGSGSIHAAIDAALVSRENTLGLLRPGADVTDVSRAIDEELRKLGFRAGRGAIGHMCGLELAEPFIGDHPVTIEENMVMILHPFVSSDDGLDKGLGLPLRGDTYVITKSGAERLNHTPFEVLDVG